MRRFRVTFSKGEAVRYVSHLDLMRTWERILRRARLRLAHTQGFNPRPRLVFAAPLPVAVTSDGEIVDVIVEDDISSTEFEQRVRPALAPGIELRSVEEPALDAPPVMATVASSDYMIELESDEGLGSAVERFLASTAVTYQRVRKGVIRQADMRPAVLRLSVEPGRRLAMRLRLDIEGTAVRPEEVVAALDPTWQVRRVHRTALQLTEARDPSAA